MSTSTLETRRFDLKEIKYSWYVVFLVSTCDAAWFEAEDSCFRVFAGNVGKTWDKAREFCLQQGGDLAIVDSEIKRNSIASNLTNIDNNFPGTYIRAFIGFRKFGEWHWLGGTNISASIWQLGYPDVLKSGECGFLARGSFDWKLAHTSCLYGLGFICETNERKSLVIIKAVEPILYGHQQDGTKCPY